MRKFLVPILFLFVAAITIPLITSQTLPENLEQKCPQPGQIRQSLPEKSKEPVSQPLAELLSNEESNETIEKTEKIINELKETIGELNETIKELEEDI